ncbi:MAG: hypothetical protein IKJ05_00410 [Oscillospiraceae bacterium]|nr:hypothetical protein [Oscillospiraceae bacterium]
MNSKLSKLLDDSRFLKLISVLMAIVLWSYVVVFVNNEHTTTIHDVPINMQYRASAYQSMGLDVIEMDITTVDVSVTGPRSVTGDLTADDIIIYPSITGIDGPGNYTFILTSDKASNISNFTINSYSRDSVTVRLDRLVSKEFPVEVDISSIVVDADYMAERPTTNPATITITGPEYKVNSVARVVAATITTETLSQTAVLPSTIRLYDANGGEIDDKLLSINVAEVDITIPIMKEVTLPVKVEYVNVPNGFDTSVLKQTLSASEIRLSVPAQTASSLTDFVVGYIDLATLKTGEKYTFDLKLPSGYRSLDEVAQISATVSGDNLTERVMNVSEIKIINDSTGDIQLLTKVINNVTIVGEKSAVDSLSAGSVIAQIDAATLSAAQGQQSVEVDFLIPSTEAAYVKGVYTVNIKK